MKQERSEGGRLMKAERKGWVETARMRKCITAIRKRKDRNT